MKNIFPTDKILQRKDKEALLEQRGLCVWFSGLSGSGKTTLAIELEKELHKKGFLTQVLDADNIRSGVNKDLGFSAEAREENIRRIAEVTKLFVNCGIITICCFLTPTRLMRDVAAGIIGGDFMDIYLSTPLEICESRDVKGLYARARRGEIADFTGISSAFEPPVNSTISLDTTHLSREECTRMIADLVMKTQK